MVDGVTERTGGVPLFVEGLTRLLLEHGPAGATSRTTCIRTPEITRPRRLASVGFAAPHDQHPIAWADFVRVTALPARQRLRRKLAKSVACNVSAGIAPIDYASSIKSTTSQTLMRSCAPSACTAAVYITVSFGQATTSRVTPPRTNASLIRFSLGRSTTPASSPQILPPPAPQQNEFSRQREVDSLLALSDGAARRSHHCSGPNNMDHDKSRRRRGRISGEACRLRRTHRESPCNGVRDRIFRTPRTRCAER
jgi:hypothetical protein